MTESQVNCFITSAICKSFSRAAAAMYISQPAVSKQVSQLEAEFGFTLFERGPSGLTLTPSGKLMYDYLAEQRNSLNSTLERARRLAGGPGSVIRMGCLEGWDLNKFYPQLTAYYALRQPSLSISIEGYSFTDMAAALKSGKADIIMSLNSNLLDHPEIHSRKLVSTGGMLAFSAKHPLAGKPGLSVADFSGETFFTIAEPEGYRHTSGHVREVCARYGFDPVIVNLPSLAATFIKLQSFEGVIFVDDWMMVGSSPLFRAVFTRDSFDIGVGWLDAPPGSNTAAFLDDLPHCFESFM